MDVLGTKRRSPHLLVIMRKLLLYGTVSLLPDMKRDCMLQSTSRRRFRPNTACQS